MITQRITVDVNHTKAPDPIVCRIGEQNTRTIRFEPVEYVDGVAEAVTYNQENPTAMLRILKPDNTFVMVNAGRAEPDDRVVFDVILPAEASQVTGIGVYDFRIYDSALEEPEPADFLYTFQGKFIIDDDMITDEMIESVAAVNGYTFPDDFLTQGADVVSQEELDETLEDYATKTYVDDAIAGASSYSETVLYNDDNPSYFTPSAPKNVELSDDYTNYDMLVLEVCENSFPTYRSQIWLLTSMIRADGTIYNGTISTLYNAWSSPAFTVTDSTHFAFKGVDSGTPMRLYKITGIKW